MKGKVASPFIVGCFQAFAILPGVSRSGSTIAAARLLGWDYKEAFRFSFLLAIPTMIGGALVEGRTLLQEDVQLAEVSLAHYIVGFVVSFGVGLLALQILRRVLIKRRISIFIWYCTLVGLFTIVYTHWIR
jgi:undecaprenyl-diphosphatase